MDAELGLVRYGPGPALARDETHRWVDFRPAF
jgi:hypothetical protein